MEIHCSMLPFYFDCPRRTACKMLKAEIKASGFNLRDDRKGIGASIGIAIHAGSHMIMDTKIKTGGVPCPEGHAVDSAMASYAKEVLDNDFDSTTPDQTTGEKQVIRQTKSYYHMVAPGIIPIKTEERMKADLGNGFVMSGKPDIIDSTNTVRDTKAGTTLRDYRTQLGSYGILSKSNKLKVDKACVDFIKRVRVNSLQPPPDLQTIDLATAEKTAWFVIKKIIADIREFQETKNPWAFGANPMSMLCSEKYCLAFGTNFCEFGKKR